MEPFKSVTGIAAPLMRINVDTDAIIPSREMKRVSKDGLADGLFAGWRYQGADNREPNPDFILNQYPYDQAEILVTGRNFGCGSSREHAPRALLDFGFRVVISSQIADIFRSNSNNIGLLAVVLEKEQHATLLQMDGEDITVDLELSEVIVRTSDGEEQNWSFSIDPFARHCLLRGLDRIDFLSRAEDAIAAYEDQQVQEWQ